MLKRKITEEIKNWYNNSTNALLIDGARQVGKTTAIKTFLEENNYHYLEINLAQDNNALEAFNTSKTSDQLFLRLTSLATTPLIENKTVIFIDEIHEADDALTPIKFLIQSTKFRYIFSGSLLGIKLKNVLSIPVGSLKILRMYPMDFEEFINAYGVSNKTIEYLNDCFKNYKEVDEIVHKQMLDLFKVYLVVGGLPKAVQTFVNSKNMSLVNEDIHDVDTGYKKDISKYDLNEKLLIEDIYDLIPSELNNQNKRFIVKKLNDRARFYEYEDSFAWLKDSGVGLFVHNIDNPVYPLLASKQRTFFKLFLCDVGLLTYKLMNGKQISLLNGNDNINFGSIYENVVAQELNAHGFNIFYNLSKKRGEIDFLIEQENKVIPIEVKSGKDYSRHSALCNLLNNPDFNINMAYILCNGNVKKVDKKIYLPVYMIMFIQNSKQESSTINIDISKLI